MRFSIVLRVELRSLDRDDLIPCIANSKSTVSDIKAQFLTTWYRLQQLPIDSHHQLVLYKNESRSAEWDASNDAASFIMSWLMHCGGGSPLHVRVHSVLLQPVPRMSTSVSNAPVPAAPPAARPPPNPASAPAARPSTSASSLATNPLPNPACDACSPVSSTAEASERAQLLKVYHEAKRYYQISRVAVPRTMLVMVYDRLREYMMQQPGNHTTSTAYPAFRQQQLEQLTSESDDVAATVSAPARSLRRRRITVQVFLANCDTCTFNIKNSTRIGSLKRALYRHDQAVSRLLQGDERIKDVFYNDVVLADDATLYDAVIDPSAGHTHNPITTHHRRHTRQPVHYPRRLPDSQRSSSVVRHLQDTHRVTRCDT